MLDKKQIGIGLAILIVVIIGAIAYIWPSDNPRTISLSKPTENTTSDIGSLRAISDSDHIRGDINAPIVVIEYSDLECPFCKRFHNSMKTVFETYKSSGKVAWVFRHFPIESLHTKAVTEAMATECAGELGGNEAFWNMLDKIYEVTPSNDGLNLETLPDLASGIGLDKQAFAECLSSSRQLEKVQNDYKNAVESGGTGTPFPIILNQQTGETIVLPGAVPTSEIITAINSLLE